MAIITDEAAGPLLDESGKYLYDELGAPFPLVPLDLECDLLLNGAWTIATSYLYQRDGQQSPVVITRGRQDGTSKATPGSAAFEVNNRSGNWSPKNPLGAWYGQLGRNTPVRLSVPALNNYLRTEVDLASGAACPNAVPLQISGDLDVRADIRLTDWEGTGSGLNIAGAGWAAGPGQEGWMLGLSSNGTGVAVLNWSPDGSAQLFARSTVPVPLGRVVLRATLQVSTGTVTFYTAAAGNISSGPWTMLGTPVASGATTLHAATLGLKLGGAIEGSGFYGALFAVEVLSGIGGTVVASPSFSSQPAGTTSFPDPQGNTWTLGGTAEVSSRDYRYHGQLSSLPPTWDSTGTDVSVKVTSGGVLRRLGQGTTPTQSPMRRAIALQSGTLAPVQYWPCEDASGGAAFGSATSGPLMTFDGAPKLAADSSFAASAPLPQLNGSRWVGRVPSYASNGAIVVRWLQKAGTAPASTTPLVQLVTTGTSTEVTLSYLSTGFVNVIGNNSGGNVFTSGSITAPGGATYAGLDLWMSLDITVSAGTVTVNLNMMAPGGAQSGVTVGTFSGSVGNVKAVYVNPSGALPDTVVGHISVQSAESPLFSLQLPLNAWIGEAAATRFARVCSENGIAARVVGPPATTTSMGAQPVDTVLNILQECETADRGLIYEPRQVLGLAYRTLASMLNQSPLQLDYSQAELGGTGSQLEPYYDDQWVRNDETVTRGSSGASSTQGATYQFALNDGSAMSVGVIGDYDNSDTVNCQYDTEVPHLASWIVHVGTVDEARWPVIPVNLARQAIQGASLYYPLLQLDVGDYLQLLNMLGVIVADPVRQLLPGMKESFGGFHHQLELNCIPESPYEVVVLDDPVRGRCDTDGSTLSAGVNSTAATLSVATTNAASPLWTTSAADFPFDIALTGERMTVTNITGASSPQSFTVTRSVNGVVKPQAAGADVRLWLPPILSLA